MMTASTRPAKNSSISTAAAGTNHRKMLTLIRKLVFCFFNTAAVGHENASKKT
jgi:hypothetical protein